MPAPVVEPVAVSTAVLAPVGPQLVKPIRITISFSNLKDVFRGDNKAAMDEFAAAAQKYVTAVVNVDGHTDDIGPDDMNQKLSVQRAQSVADYLISKGVPKSRIVVTGYGEERPVREGSNATAQGRMENRRVELTLEQR